MPILIYVHLRLYALPCCALHCILQLVCGLHDAVVLVLRALRDERRRLRHETWDRSISKKPPSIDEPTVCAPMSLCPCAAHSARAHCRAKSRTRASSERVCMRTSRLIFLSRSSSFTAPPSATRPADMTSLGLWPPAETHRETWATNGGTICCSLSSRQNPVTPRSIADRDRDCEEGTHRPHPRRSSSSLSQSGMPTTRHCRQTPSRSLVIGRLRVVAGMRDKVSSRTRVAKMSTGLRREIPQ